MTRVSVEYDEPKMLIGGELVGSVSGETFTTENPATGEPITEIPRANAEDVDRAVEAAMEGFEVWSTEYSARDRAKKLNEVADLLRANHERLGAIDAADAGNPVSAMQTDPFIAAEYTDTMASFALENKGETTPVSPDTLNYTLRQPYGVVARIIPFNHPVLFAGSKPSAPLVAGNSVVLKPPEQASISALELGRMINDADILPPGVLNVVTGFGDEVGSPLVTHEDVHKIGFTGSVPTGSIIQKQAADKIADVSLELGGKNPLLAYPDADVEEVVEGALEGMNLGWQGESCGSISRLFLHESFYEEAVEMLAAKVSEVELGDPLDDETEMGAVTSQDQYDKSMKYIELAQEEGATLHAGGGHADGEALADGYFVEPTVFGDVTQDMRVANEEVFGPVIFAMKWSDEEQLMADANAVDYGLTGSIYTNDLATAHEAAERLEAGYIWINDTASHHLGAPFGGWKQSGVGREEALDEVLAYSQVKNVNVSL